MAAPASRWPAASCAFYASVHLFAAFACRAPSKSPRPASLSPSRKLAPHTRPSRLVLQLPAGRGRAAAVCAHLATRSSFFMALSFFMKRAPLYRGVHIQPFPISFEPAGRCAVSNERSVECEALVSTPTLSSLSLSELPKTTLASTIFRLLPSSFSSPARGPRVMKSGSCSNSVHVLSCSLSACSPLARPRPAPV